MRERLTLLRIRSEAIEGQGYGRIPARGAALRRRWRSGASFVASRRRTVPLQFSPGEAYELTGATQYVVLAGVTTVMVAPPALPGQARM